jgi:sigma-E factor negative regulatory protein RseC
MLETRAIVISLDGNEALVESLQGGGCGNCDSENGCGSGKLSQLFCRESRRFRVRNEANAQIGATVQIALAEGLLIRSALLVYVLPLLLLVAGALVGSVLISDEQSQDVYSAIGGLAGLISGFVIAKNISLSRNITSVALPAILPK